MIASLRVVQVMVAILGSTSHTSQMDSWYWLFG